MMKRIQNCSGYLVILVGLALIGLAVWQIYQTGNFNIRIPGLSGQPTATPGDSLTVVQALTTQGGTAPHFSRDGKSVYYLNPSGLLEKVDLASGSSQVIWADTLAAPRLVWHPSEDRALVEWLGSVEEGEALDVYDAAKGKHQAVAEYAWGAGWRPDGKKITYISSDEEGLWVWEANPTGSGARHLIDLAGIVAPEYAAWSPQQNRVLVQFGLGVIVYAVQDGVAIQTNWIEGAGDSAWSADGWYIVFWKDGGWWMANLDGNNPELLIPGPVSEIGWLPDGRMVYFTAGKAGGAACWAYTIGTRSAELLADASSMVWKPVGQFDISPQGDRLVYEGQDQQLWLLRIR